VRIAFLGTPEVAVPALTTLLDADDVEVAAVITNPDRAKGRSKRPVPPPVKVAAEAAGVPVWQPVKPREVLDDLRALDVDACAVVAYGALLPTDVLEAGGAGMVNLHFSLLPRWRGAAPVQHALRAGDRVTGVTTFVLEQGMDTGPVLAQHEVEVDPDESAGDLLARLAELGGPILLDSLRRLVAGETPVPQPDEGVTLAPKITPDDVAIDLTLPARQVTDLVRSADPAPGAHTRFRDKRLKVLRAPTLSDDEVAALDGGEAALAAAPAGTVVGATKAGVVVACGQGAVRLEEVQPEGKGRIDGAAFANGYRPEVGERLGDGPDETLGEHAGEPAGEGAGRDPGEGAGRDPGERAGGDT
jgi:methionyl-tRNA formyltransferase